MDAPRPQSEAQPKQAFAVRWRKAGFALVAVAIVLVGVVLRLRIAAYDLESPLIDENEVVEQAVAFMGGDLDQHFVKYGPLTMYLLAGMYRVVAAVRGLSALEYASLVFFHGEQHYFLARSLTGLAISGLALASFFVLRRRLGVGPAWVAGTLLALPCIDRLVNGARIDMLQACFQGLALLALGEVSQAPRRRYWLAAGVAAGLGIASKPLPGLLLLPCFPVASWFAAGASATGEPRRFWQRVWASLTSPGLWLAALACLAAAVLADPALLDTRAFIASQREAVELHTGRLSAGPSIFESLALLGLPFCVALGLSGLVVVARGDAAGRLVALFCVMYLGAFWGRSRHYFLAAAAAAACLLIGHGVATAARLWAPGRQRLVVWGRVAAVPAALILCVLPLAASEARLATPSPRTQARAWVLANIPAGTRLHYVGWRGAGPVLVAQNATTQAQFGDHFSYGRERYTFLKEAFARGYAAYVRENLPRYAIAFHHDKPFARSSGRTPRPITDGLLAQARSKGRRYIIIAGYSEPDVFDLGYPWFRKAVLVQQFGQIAIFRVPEQPTTKP